MILPYAAWMALMLLLPSTAWAYALRTAVVSACLIPLTIESSVRAALRRALSDRGALLAGLLAGAAVWILWVAPEYSAFYRKWFVLSHVGLSGPSPYDPAVCGWPLTLARLFGSAFVIAAVEEIFFRRWLYNWLGADKAAFFWMVALFAVEHDRWLAGALAGAVYGLLALRKGLFAAIAAHSATNLLLGIQVVSTGNWKFW